MVHVGVGLDAHELVDAHRARRAHPPEIVALEIDQHHVLGAFLGMRGELGHLARVAAGLAAPRAGAGDRPGLDAPPRDAHQPLGRGAQDRLAAPLGERGEGRGIRGAEPPIERRRRARRPVIVESHRPGTREVRLVDVAGAHVFLRASHAREIRARVFFLDPPDAQQIKLLNAVRERSDLHPLVIHVNYLVNLASLDPVIRARSIACFHS